MATVSPLALRSVSAWALPRPSAMASAKLAKRTVNHSHKVICRLKAKLPWWLTTPWISRTVVSTLPISTTNMTGFFTIRRGSSLRNESKRRLTQDRGVPETLFFCHIVSPRL